MSAAVKTTTTHRPEPYRPPQVTPLGRWASLTLVQSVPVGPGGWLPIGNRQDA
ncbi:hypothetical protein ACFOLM_11025 [Deinococcus soli (ex Cha et al. 2016)]|uniref:hypothetical protein n=1 Tax=Deinococcus soli (ex Cha et al. 2016) TaxID=1309411 RepID=UPI0036147767